MAAKTKAERYAPVGDGSDNTPKGDVPPPRPYGEGNPLAAPELSAPVSAGRRFPSGSPPEVSSTKTPGGSPYDGGDSPYTGYESPGGRVAGRDSGGAAAAAPGPPGDPSAATGQPSVVDWNEQDIARWMAAEGIAGLRGVLHGIDRGVEQLALSRADLSTTPHSPGSAYCPGDLDNLWGALQRLRVRERDCILHMLHTNPHDNAHSPQNRASAAFSPPLSASAQQPAVPGVAQIKRHVSAHSMPEAVSEQIPVSIAELLLEPMSRVSACLSRVSAEWEKRQTEVFVLRHVLTVLIVLVIVICFQSRPAEWQTLGRVRLKVMDKESEFKGDIYSLSSSRDLILDLADDGASAWITVNLFVPPVDFEQDALMPNRTKGSRPSKSPKIFANVQAQHINGTWIETGESMEMQLLADKPTMQKKRLRGLWGEWEGFQKARVALSVSRISRGRAAFSHIPLKVKLGQHPGLIEHGPILGFLILFIMYALIMFEAVPKPVAAMAASSLAVALNSYINERPQLEDLVGWIDVETISLLFGMMVMVGLLSGTGFFEFAAAKAYRLSGGRTWRLVVILCIFTAVVSAILDNVTTVLLLAPVTLRLCKVLSIPPQPVLMAEVVFSNIGGTLTPIGDPPNVIIANDDAVQASGVTFFSFTIHMFGGVVMAMGACLLLLKRLIGKELQRTNSVSDALRNEMVFYERLSGALAGTTTDMLAPKMFCLQRIAEIQHDLDRHAERDRRRRERRQLAADEGRPAPPDESPDVAHPSCPTAQELEDMYKITDRTLFIQCAVVIGIVVLLFFLHSTIQLQMSISMISLLGAISLVAITNRSMESILHKVEWPTLLFFSALFVLMRALEELGLVETLTDAASSTIKGASPGSQTIVAVVLILWLSALVSAFIDNIPFTAAMVPVVTMLAEDPELNVSLQPLVWALAFGTCFGGNGTLIGASANVVVAGLADQDGHPISFLTFFKIGFPIMLLSTVAATLYLLVLAQF